MTDINVNESHKALEALREELKSAMPNKEIVEKCNSFLDGQEEKNQELVKRYTILVRREESIIHQLHW